MIEFVVFLFFLRQDIHERKFTTFHGGLGSLWDDNPIVVELVEVDKYGAIADNYEADFFTLSSLRIIPTKLFRKTLNCMEIG